MDRPDGVSTLRHYLHVLWRRKWIGLAPLVLIPLVALGATLRQGALYEASADVLVNRQEVATTSLIGETPALDDANRTMQTHASLARVPSVIERTLAAVDETDRPTRAALLGHSSVTSLADILRFTVSDSDTARAVGLASAYARAFVQYRTELDTAGLGRTLDGLRTRLEELEAAGRVDSPLYVTLADREQQLESLIALRTSNVSLVRPAEVAETTQVAPRPRRNTAVALSAGLVVGLLLVFLAESLSTRPRSNGEFEDLLGMPLLARLGAGTQGKTALVFGDRADADAVQSLRLNLELVNRTVGARTIMITSPRSREEKSATTAQLGVALARAGRHVTLVDLDLRESSLTRLVGLGERCGVTALARGECELADALVAMPVDDGGGRGASADSNGRREPASVLEVVGSGPPVPHPAEFLSSKSVAPVLAELLRGRADVVLVDVPPVLAAPDAAAVAAHVDGVLLVVSPRDARGPILADTRRVLDSWPVASLGFALIEGGDERPLFGQLHRGKLSERVRSTEPERVA